MCWRGNWEQSGIFLNNCKFLKQEGTGNVLESIKRVKKGVHIFSPVWQALIFYKQKDDFKKMACQFIFCI